MSTRIKNVQSGLCFLLCFGVAVCVLAGCTNHTVPSVNVEPSVSVNVEPSVSVNVEPSVSVNVEPSVSVNVEPSVSVNVEPSVNVEKHAYASGEDILVNFSNGPGNKDDWIGIFNAGDKPGSGDGTLLWLYADGTNATGEDGHSTKGVNAGEKSVSDGSVVFDSASDNAESTTVDWPLAEGDYDVYFFCCFGSDVLAGPAEFTIDSGDGN